MARKSGWLGTKGWNYTFVLRRYGFGALHTASNALSVSVDASPGGQQIMET
jgi:hypothetical protein